MSNETAYICFCVEGPTDTKALREQFDDLFDKMFGDQVEIEFRYPVNQNEIQGDLTSKSGITPENIEKSIYKYYFKSKDIPSNISWSDFTYIIHIIDIDGVYVKDDNITAFSDNESAFADSISNDTKTVNILYLDDHIAVRHNSGAIIARNENKRRNIEYLRNKEELSISSRQRPKKYRMYYFSSNLDHVISGKPNLATSEKIKGASEFSNYVSDGDLLADFFRNFHGCTETDYSRSWDILRKGNNSLQPRSNINILIEDILNSKLEDWL